MDVEQVGLRKQVSAPAHFDQPCGDSRGGLRPNRCVQWSAVRIVESVDEPDDAVRHDRGHGICKGEPPGAHRSGTRSQAERKKHGGDRRKDHRGELGGQKGPETDSERNRPRGRRTVDHSPVGASRDCEDERGDQVGRRQGAVRNDDRTQAIQNQCQQARRGPCSLRDAEKRIHPRATAAAATAIRLAISIASVRFAGS